jgi:signal transduction histidine kinase
MVPTNSDESPENAFRIEIMPEIPEQHNGLSHQPAFTLSAPQARRTTARDNPTVGPTDLGWLVRQLPQCVFVCDVGGRCVLANGSLLAWLGCEESDVVGRSISEIWPDDPEAVALRSTCATRESADLQLVLEGGRIEQVETRIGADGPRAVRAVKFPWLGASGQIEGMVVVFDELDFAAAGEAGSLTDPEKVGLLAKGIIHDFNNALMMLYGHVSMAEERLPDWLRAKGLLDGLRSALDHACWLPRQLVGIIRGEPPVRQRLDLNTLLASLEVFLRPRLGSKTSLVFRFAVGGTLVKGDPGQLTQVLLNLTDNALDAMPNGGQLTIETRPVTLAGAGAELAVDATETICPPARAARTGSFIRITIRDSGSGIAPEALPHVFDTGFTTRPAGKGSGLGLAIVKEIVAQHGGWVTCQSKFGQGASFILHLPALGAEDNLDRPRLKPSARVLVVEPDAAIRQLALVHLGDGPLYCEAVERMEDAWVGAVAKQGGFDLVVISDDQLSSGSAGLSRLLAGLPEAGLLVTYTTLMPALPDECKPLVRGTLPKPYRGEELLAAVQGILGKKATVP